MNVYQFNSNKNIQIISPNLPANFLQLILHFLKYPLLVFKAFSFNPKKMNTELRQQYFLKLFNNNEFNIIHFEFSGLAVSFLDILKK
jgi:ABC-type spermidine/putrescine transport system permease subunit II